REAIPIRILKIISCNLRFDIKETIRGKSNAVPIEAIKVYREKLLKSTLRPTRITGNKPAIRIPSPKKKTSHLHFLFSEMYLCVAHNNVIINKTIPKPNNQSVLLKPNFNLINGVIQARIRTSNTSSQRVEKTFVANTNGSFNTSPN